MIEGKNMMNEAPFVPLWKTWGLRVIFAAMVMVLGTKQVSFILGGAAEWAAWRGLGHSMLVTLALLAIVGVFRPLAMLPLMIYEMVWKAVWLLIIALPAWMDGQPIPSIVSVTGSSIGIVLLTILIPWRYVWWCYIAQPVERWRPIKREVNAS